MKRVGIYSGSFDPVHAGHLAFAREAIARCGLDKVFFLVEPRPRRKQGVRALEHRAAMVRLAVKDDNQLGTIVLGQSRFTAVDTLPILQRRFKGAQLYMLMGDDGLTHLGEWPHVDELIEGLRFVVGRRKAASAEVKSRIEIIQKTRGLQIRYTDFAAPKAALSSSGIRRSLKKGVPVTDVSPEVLRYVRTHGLYESGSSSKS
jgi:nicotinate-nucleotide adenylyltransferase